MKISKNEGNISINLAAQDNPLENVKKEEQKEGSIYAGDINMNKVDNVVDKKIKAQRKVLKTIMTAYEADNKIDESQETRRDRNKVLRADAIEANTEKSKLIELEKQKKETYKIEEDSQEQKDLELLLKQEASRRFKPGMGLTREEREYLENMGPITDYQKDMLELYNLKEDWNDVFDKSVKEITGNNQVISAVEVNRLKFTPMVSAAKESEKIIKATSKEIIDSLKNEAKDHIDEKLEEEKEKGEEIKEKKEEEEAKREEIKADQPDDNMSIVAKVEEVQNKLDAEIKKMQDELLKEDIKGLTVNKKL